MILAINILFLLSAVGLFAFKRTQPLAALVACLWLIFQAATNYIDDDRQGTIVPIILALLIIAELFFHRKKYLAQLKNH